jgi:glycyl-tRNA synthetase beta chain
MMAEHGQFVRPVHGLRRARRDVVPLSLGLKAGRSTLGHRFESAGELSIRHADSYEEQMENEGASIPNFNKRRAEIVRQLKVVADSIGGVESIDDDALLDEVTSLVELPNVLAASLSRRSGGSPGVSDPHHEGQSEILPPAG